VLVLSLGDSAFALSDTASQHYTLEPLQRVHPQDPLRCYVAYPIHQELYSAANADV